MIQVPPPRGGTHHFIPDGALGTSVQPAADFEEVAPAAGTESYLWGNAAFAAAFLLADAFTRAGWELTGALESLINDMPMHVRKVDGERHVQPSTDAPLSDHAADAIIRRGLMPLQSYLNRNTVQLPRLQSLCDPPKPLAGRWT